MKASEITVDAILYFDKSPQWDQGHRGSTPKMKVLDPTPRHWLWDRRSETYVDQGRRTPSTQFGILVEVLATPDTTTYLVGGRQVARLNALRGPYEEVAARVAETRAARLGVVREERDRLREQMGRQERAIADAAKIGVKATGLFPGTTIQVPIEQFEAMVSELEAGNWHVA